jgi:hypothetical protein
MFDDAFGGVPAGAARNHRRSRKQETGSANELWESRAMHPARDPRCWAVCGTGHRDGVAVTSQARGQPEDVHLGQRDGSFAAVLVDLESSSIADTGLPISRIFELEPRAIVRKTAWT